MPYCYSERQNQVISQSSGINYPQRLPGFSSDFSFQMDGVRVAYVSLRFRVRVACDRAPQ